MTYRDMSDVTRIQYLRSEIVVSRTLYEAATKILVCPIIRNNQMNDKNLQEMMEKAVKTALKLAIVTDKLITQSGNAESGL